MLSCLSQREEGIVPELGPAACVLGVSSGLWPFCALLGSPRDRALRGELQGPPPPGGSPHSRPPASAPWVTASCHVTGIGQGPQVCPGGSGRQGLAKEALPLSIIIISDPRFGAWDSQGWGFNRQSWRVGLTPPYTRKARSAERLSETSSRRSEEGLGGSKKHVAMGKVPKRQEPAAPEQHGPELRRSPYRQETLSAYLLFLTIFLTVLSFLSLTS